MNMIIKKTNLNLVSIVLKEEIQMRAYEKPVITVDSGMAEGIYAASGATQGTLNVTYYGVWDRMAEKVWLWQTGPELMEPSL